MSIISITFLLFTLAVFIVYYLVPGRYQWVVMLISSYCFYATGGVGALVFVVGTTLVTYGAGMLMERNKTRNESKKAAKKQNRKVLIGIIILIFGVLFMLKYMRMFTVSPIFAIVLPMGISFYMFQSIGYCIDVYRNKVETETKLLRYALFISFFPLAVQGPISRYGQLGGQLKEEHKFEYNQFTKGLQLMIWGFFKKMIIADRLSVIVGTVFDDYTAFDGTQTAVAIACYALQIYIDFSGGIDIVRGVAQCMGIDLIENFERPYFAPTIADHWRRWHIALTSWMREYVFYSLALSKFSNRIGKWGRSNIKGHIGKQLPSYLPTFVTFFLIGIWHGAGWGFIVFGFYNATVIVLSMMLQPVWEGLNRTFRINTGNPVWKAWQMIRTFIVMSAGRCMTRAVSVGAGLAMLGSCTHVFDFTDFVHRMLSLGLNFDNCLVLALSCILMFIVSILQERGMNVRDTIGEKNIVIRWIIWIAGIVAVIIFGMYGPGYDAGAFIYKGF